MDNIGLNVVRGKIWGNTTTIFAKNNVEIARIDVNKGGYCSTHKHMFKYNMFYVESGTLKVTILRPDAGSLIEDITTLSAGQSTYVEPGLLHNFCATDAVIAYEIYWTTMAFDDIIRESVGGVGCK